ncbi:hypothetical protein [Actinokineospora terrae]|uniref:hypothetical protein n=1 Tax=Actinokineospora terrae TaxID=155974 RepID=UPI0011606842|nr:hypothetical protein [Actinokineospora terrae]
MANLQAALTRSLAHGMVEHVERFRRFCCSVWYPAQWLGDTERALVNSRNSAELVLTGLCNAENSSRPGWLVNRWCVALADAGRHQEAAFDDVAVADRTQGPRSQISARLVLARARTALEEAGAIEVAIDEPGWHHEDGLLHHLEGDDGRAAAALGRAVMAARRVDDVALAAKIRLDLAAIHLAAGRAKVAARQSHDLAVDLAAHGPSSSLASAYALAARAHGAIGLHVEARTSERSHDRVVTALTVVALADLAVTQR